ncbi:MAG: glutaredoxin family protein [bacterium]|nr:glutaredoxin family protein [bacterium]
MARRQIVFLTREGCGLCDGALPKVQSAARWLRREVDITDIDTNAEYEAEYHIRIPVVLDNRGRVVGEGPMTRLQAWAAVWRS